MFQIVAIVCAIAIGSLFALAGINYVSSDVGAREIAYEAASSATLVVGQGLASYRRANGVFPTETRWEDDLRSYVPGGRLPSPLGFVWSYETEPGSARLCLTAPSDKPVPAATMAALRKVVDGRASSWLAARCSDGPNAADGAERVAVFEF